MNVRLDNITIKCMLAIMLSALFASCKDEMDEYEGGRPSRMDVLGMKFTTLYDGFEKPTTRAIIESVADIDQVCVLSMKKKDDIDAWSQVFDNDTLVITNIGDEIWYYPTEKKKKWEADYNYKFRAFYPYKFNTGAGESCDGFTWAGFSIGQTELRLNNYKSASNPRNNSDLLVSQSVEREKGETNVVALEMKHLMACVNFKFKTTADATITKFVLTGHSTEGSCVVKSSPSWNSSVILDDGSMKLTFYNIEDRNLYELSYEQSKFIFRDKKTDTQISSKEASEYISQHKNDFYVAVSTSGIISSNDFVVYASKNVNESDDYKGLLVIPQVLDKGSVPFKLIADMKWKRYWNGEWHEGFENQGLILDDVILKQKVFAEMEFYFNDKPNEKMIATVDLTNNGKLLEWEAGKKYTYNIAMYEYQVNANIDVEDWTHYTYEEELK